jgi:multidrug efflux system membrane fusion protein
MSRTKWIVIIIVVVLAGVIGWRLTHRAGSALRATDDAPIPVTVVPVRRENVPVYLTALGTVQALNTVTVVPQVSGQLVSIDFREGHELKKGDLIAQIDPRTFQASLEQAIGKQQQDFALLSAAQYTLHSYEGLSKQQFVAAQTLQAQQQTVHQYQAAVAADRAAVDSARVQLGYTSIRAPIDGVAGLRQVDVGNIVGPGTTGGLVVLTQIHPISVIFSLPQQNLDGVRAAFARNALDVAALDRTDNHVIANGTLKVVDNQIDPTTGSFKLKAEFPNTENNLWPGQFVNVRMQLSTVNGGLVVPAQAVQRGPDGDYVFVVQPDKTVAMRTVTTGGEVGNSAVLIAKGVQAGERVVTEGQFRLKSGSKVIPLAPGQVPPVPSAATGQGKRGGRG